MNFEQTIRKSGLKSTKSRAGILGILRQSDQPISAEAVFLECKKKNLATNLSTVYRTLETLAGKELVTKISLSDANKALYEYNRMVHRHYLICLGCRKMLAIHACPLKDYERSLAEKTDFAIEGHKLDIYGYCPACRGKNPTRD